MLHHPKEIKIIIFQYFFDLFFFFFNFSFVIVELTRSSFRVLFFKKIENKDWIAFEFLTRYIHIIVRDSTEFCSTLVWTLNSSSILQELTLASIAIFTAINAGEEGANLTKNHLKYHLVSLSVISACVGVTGVLNFEPELCVFLAQEISPKYGIFVNSLRCLLIAATAISLLVALVRRFCRPPKSELLKSVSDLSETSSKNSSGAFECHPQHWDPSSGSCTSGSTNSRACLRKKRVQIDETSGRPTTYSILFVCYVFQYLPILVSEILLFFFLEGFDR